MVIKTMLSKEKEFYLPKFESFELIFSSIYQFSLDFWGYSTKWIHLIQTVLKLFGLELA